MATVVAVLDRDGWQGRTDNIVVADPLRCRLLWVPRDMWVEELHDRINTAFRTRGHEALLRAVASLGIPVQHSTCLRREAVERALSGTSVTVRVRERLELWYPLDPRGLIEEGRKPVDFNPPAETLHGERIHQWVGARLHRGGPGSDLDRIGRQAVLVRALLRDRFEFARALAEPTWVTMSSAAALDELRRVRAWWRFRCFGPVADATADGKEVLVPQGRRRLLARRMR
jgi:anionic cell wall polymer biosynthesis LytR-Cps2A-Psr (LCP) family protein